jgi:hypothetical protein
MTCASCAARIEEAEPSRQRGRDGQHATEAASVAFDPASVTVDDLVAR